MSGDPHGPVGWIRRSGRSLVRPMGSRRWDVYLRSTATLGLLGIGVVLLYPRFGAFVGLVLYTLWVTGPLSPFFPVGLEPVVMIFGRLYDPLLIGAGVTIASLYVEFFTYYLYRTALRHRASRRFSESDTVQKLQSWFERAPFFTMWIVSWTPIPYWAGRILASLSGYSVARYLTATFLGRLPKFWALAVLGRFWHIDSELLVGVVVVTTLATLVPWFFGGRGGGAEDDEEPGGGDDGPSEGEGEEGSGSEDDDGSGDGAP